MKELITQLKDYKEILTNEISSLKSTKGIIQNDLEHYEQSFKSIVVDIEIKEEKLKCSEELIIRLENDSTSQISAEVKPY